MGRRRALLLSLLSVLVPVVVLAADGLAQASGAHATQTITLTVDATEAPRKLFHAREVIPVSPGPLTLHYRSGFRASMGRLDRSIIFRGWHSR